MRYAVESDTPDNGRSTYSECFGPNGRRGRVLEESDNLAVAIQAAAGFSPEGMPSRDYWIYDRRACRIVTKTEIKAAGGRVTTQYPS